MERILVAIDGSAAALKAVEFAVDLANKYNAELILLTVVPDLSPVIDPAVEEYARVEHIQGRASEFGMAAAQTVLDDARRMAQTKGAMRISAEPILGDPAEKIVTAARDRQADLVVIGSRGHGRLAGLLFGSVAQKVITLAPCPVTVVR
jgi:nucleotide-binding universal stress UspA family protein